MDNLLDSIQVDTVFLDSDLRVRKFTLGIAKTFRLLPQDVGRQFDSFNHELRNENLIDQIQQVLADEKPFEEEVQDANGNWYLMRLLPYNTRGTVDGVLVTLIDITGMKETERELAQLSEIVQSSDDAIFRITPEGVIRTWNQGAEQLFSYSPEYMIGRNISVLTVDEDGQETVNTALDRIVSRKRLDQIEIKAVRRNGEQIDANLTVSPIYGPDGELDAASIILRDITRQKISEALNRDEVRRRDQFLAMLSHELRNPIAAIMSSLAVMRKQADKPEKNRVAISVIQRHSKQLSKLLDDLLDVSRITHDKIKLDIRPHNIVSLASQAIECVESRISAKNQLLSFDEPGEPVYVNVDETRVVQAQVNLLVNATKYTPNGGSIKFSIRREDDFAVIEVEDDGEGMSEDLRQKVFKVFVQAEQPLHRNQGGMGLGLPLVKLIAQAHGGRISAHSRGIGEGSRFTLHLPLSTTLPVDEHHAISGPTDVPLDGIKLLLVEDNDGSRQMMAEYLQSEGLQVITASNGGSGVEEYQRQHPDVCVVDIGLPDLNGYEVAQKIKASQRKPELLIALTGYGQEKDIELALKAGFDLHLTKPIDPEELVAIVARQVFANAS